MNRLGPGGLAIDVAAKKVATASIQRRQGGNPPIDKHKMGPSDGQIDSIALDSKTMEFKMQVKELRLNKVAAPSPLSGVQVFSACNFSCHNGMQKVVCAALMTRKTLGRAMYSQNPAS